MRFGAARWQRLSLASAALRTLVRSFCTLANDVNVRPFIEVFFRAHRLSQYGRGTGTSDAHPASAAIRAVCFHFDYATCSEPLFCWFVCSQPRIRRKLSTPEAAGWSSLQQLMRQQATTQAPMLLTKTTMPPTLSRRRQFCKRLSTEMLCSASTSRREWNRVQPVQ